MFDFFQLEIHLCHACLKSKNEEGVENGEMKTEKLMFQFRDVVRCCAKAVDLDFAKRETLMIDSAISGASGALVERELVQWQADDGDEISEALDDLGVCVYLVCLTKKLCCRRKP